MKNKPLVLSGIVFSLLFLGVGQIFAEDAAGWKQTLKSDKEQIKEEKLEIKENALEGRTEEAELRSQIQAALNAGDKATAEKLRERLRALHKENVQERIEDRKELQSDIRELKSDLKEARQEGYLRPKIDKDNNPPGPVGGAGTNWENPPGPKGGAGASPDRRGR